jgi:hypothetical protein
MVAPFWVCARPQNETYSTDIRLQHRKTIINSFALRRRKPRGASDDGVIGYLRAVRWMMRGFGVVVAIVCIAVGASWSRAAAPPGPSAGVPRAVQDFEVRLVPPVQGGWVGWCTEVRRSGGSSGSCPVLPEPGQPILDESWSASSPPLVTVGVAVTSSRVAAVSINGGPPIPTRAKATLPHGFRAVMVEIPGQETPPAQPGENPNLGCLAVHQGREAFERCLGPVLDFRFTPLDAKGAPIPRGGPGRPIALRSRYWQRPNHPPRGVCQIATTRLPGLSAQWGHVVTTRPRPYPGIIGRAFLSCADTEYYLHNWPLDVGVLLDVGHPGTRPAPLPAMKPVREHPGVFAAPGEGGMLAARRIGNTWLVVQGGSGQPQRLAVLGHVRAITQL